MAAIPISDIVFNVKRSLLDGVCPTFVGIDRGCSLSKAVYLTKNGDGDTSTHYAMHCVLFSNNDFEDCLHYLKKNAKLSTSGIIRVTGAGCDKYREKIEEIIGLKVHFILEHLALLKGTHFLMTNVEDHSQLFYPDVASRRSQDFKFPPDTEAILKEMKKSLSINNGPDPNALLPCIFVVVGSAIGYIVLNSDGTFTAKGSSMAGGKTLIALGKALANARDYDHLMELAKVGQVKNIDTTIKDILREDPDSPYGRFPSDLPVFPLGKLVDEEKFVDEFKQEDRAASAVRFMALNIMTNVQYVAVDVGINRIVFGGHGIRGEALREALAEVSEWVSHGGLDLKFLRTGGTGAVGAMLSEPSNKK